MTDKEWKELCKWVKSLKNRNVYVIKNEWISVGNCFEGNLGFFKDGMIYGEGVIAENRTAKQMKEIIKNLLEV